jgi:prolyl oligopeptidase PreP (S9A serine peptidase family)
MIIEFKQTPASTNFFVKLKDKTFTLKLFKRVHLKEIVRLRLMKNTPILYSEFQELLFSLKDYWTSSDNSIYNEQDYFRILNKKWR